MPNIYLSNFSSIDNEITGYYQIEAYDIPKSHREGNFHIEVDKSDITVYLDQFNKYNDALIEEIKYNYELKELITEMQEGII